MNNRQLLNTCSSLFESLLQLSTKKTNNDRIYDSEYKELYKHFYDSASCLIERYSDILDFIKIKYNDSRTYLEFWEHKWHTIARIVESELKINKRDYSGIDVLFQNLRDNIIVEIGNAESEIIIAMAWLTDSEIWNILQGKICQGIMIEIIISDAEENFSKSNKSYLSYISDQGGNVWVTKTNNDEGMMHHKFCVIDKKHTITGSYNWTYKGGFNLENIVIIRNNIVTANQYVKKFNQIKTLTETVKLNDFINVSNTVLV